MPDVFGSGDAEEATGSKANFVGKVAFSRVECDCPICESGREAGGDQYESDIDHLLAIEPLTEYDKQQNVLSVNARKSFGSKWMVFIGHLENTIGPLREYGVDSFADLCELLTGRVFEFRELTFEEDEMFTWEHAKGGDGYTANIHNLFSDMTNPPDAMLLPVREVDDPNELADVGAEESGEVEEVDF